MLGVISYYLCFIAPKTANVDWTSRTRISPITVTLKITILKMDGKRAGTCERQKV